MGACALIFAAALCTGCRSSGQSYMHVEVAAWELEQARPVAPVFVGRARVAFDEPLPDRVVQELSEVYALVTITDPADWEAVRKRLDVVDHTDAVDLSRGSIVGILADVGESAEPDWPIDVFAVRVAHGAGWMDVRFAPGLYYPLRTASYLELVYVPGLYSVRYIQINDHRFRILRDASAH